MCECHVNEKTSKLEPSELRRQYFASIANIACHGIRGNIPQIKGLSYLSDYGVIKLYLNGVISRHIKENNR